MKASLLLQLCALLGAVSVASSSSHRLLPLLLSWKGPSVCALPLCPEFHPSQSVLPTLQPVMHRQSCCLESWAGIFCWALPLLPSSRIAFQSAVLNKYMCVCLCVFVARNNFPISEPQEMPSCPCAPVAFGAAAVPKAVPGTAGGHGASAALGDTGTVWCCIPALLPVEL